MSFSSVFAARLLSTSVRLSAMQAMQPHATRFHLSTQPADAMLSSTTVRGYKLKTKSAAKKRYKISKSGKVIAHPSRARARGILPAVALSLPRAHVQQFEHVLNNPGPHRAKRTIATATLPRSKPDRKPKK
mmetsp:Transcript_53303/g.133809  ORF Transcript_53303/g.133809 Transcript_53303/m.133809 type:complete len:131 (-) Transcript_53303:49-441(-)